MTPQTKPAQHTPGPWHEALKDTVKDHHWAHIENGQRLIAFAYGHDEQSHANARLIAQAPDLLAQRDELLAALRRLVTEQGQTLNQRAVTQALNAIARVEGRQE